MSVLNDQQLISQFIQQKDHDAFAELVRRHVDWVCSMATRLCSGDRAMGEDVTQAVFVLLARKASSLRRESQLSNWLFAVTRFCVKNALRNEISHRRREKEAAAMRDEAAEPSDAPPWETLAPVLDEMVGKLRAVDREAVLMRFYQSKTFPQIGAALRISEDAARKRVSRAIEQLRGSLARQGIAVSAVVLGGLMSANLTHSASAAVVAGATAASAAVPQAVGPIAHLTQLIMAFVSVKPVAVLVASIVLVSGTTAVLLQVNGGSNAAAAPATMPASPKTSYLRLVTDDDKPVAGAKIMRFAKRHEAFMQQRLLDTLASDANGRFQLSDIGETIEYATIVVQAPGFGLSGGYLPKGTSSEDPGEIRVHPASKLKLKFIDPDGKPAGSLRVRLAGVGNTSPANRWTIEFPDSMADSFTQTADADGVCTFPDLPQSGVAWVEPLDDRYVGLGWRQKFDLKDEEISDAGTIKLKPAGSISGQVTFADSKAPAAGVRILVRARDYDSGVQDTMTDAQGHYELKQLASGSYSVVPYLSKEMAESYASGGRDGVRVLAGLPVQNQDFTLVAGGVVRGKVAEKTSGKPLANMQIFIDAASRPFVGYTQDATTREDGTYLVHVPPGKVRVQFALPIPKGYLEPKPLSRELTIADNQTVNVNFDVPSNPMAPISGRTVDAAGHPLAGVEILGQGSDDYPPGYSLTFSDAEGNFTLPGIDPGTTLRARRGRWTTVQPVTAAAGARNLAITLRNDAAISIRAHIADADGKPIASAKVELTSSRPKRPGYIYHDEKSTAPDGTCLFRSVNPDMEYRLVVEAKGFGPTDAKLTLEPGKLIDAPVIKLVRADSFISGIVMDDQGNPVPDADVQASSGGPRSESLIGGSRRARSGITGSFRIEEILPGDVLDVRAWTDDGKAGDTLGVPAGSENIVITIKPRPAPR